MNAVPSIPGPVGSTQRWQPQRLNYSHQALVEQILANPTASNAKLGLVFGRSKEWVGMVKNSGLFRELIAKKRSELMDPVLQAEFEERLDMVSMRAVEVLAEKLSKPAAEIPDDLVMQAAIFGAKAKGVGGYASRPVAPPPPVDANRIERLADRLTALGRVQPAPQEISDATILSEPSAEGAS